MRCAIAILLAAACGQAEPEQTPEPTPSEQPEAPSPETPTVSEVWQAVFLGETLSTCTRQVFSEPKPGTRDEVHAELDLERARLIEAQPELAGTGDREEMWLSRSCLEQFQGRTAFATCVQSGAGLTFHTKFYTLDSIETDRTMRSCLRGGGDWQAIPRNSPPAEAERLRLERERLRPRRR